LKSRFDRQREKEMEIRQTYLWTIDAHKGGRGRGAPYVPPVKIFENFHIKVQ
jgi:hypothetical protein